MSIRRMVRPGFSLLEVVIAVAIFSTAIVVILGLMGPLTSSTREVLDSTVAARLADGVDRELKRGLSFDELRTQTASSATPLVLYATQDGGRVILHENRDVGPDPVSPNERYFVLFVAQLDEPASSDAFAALVIRAEWPYLQNLELPTSDATRTGFAFHTAILP